LKVIFGFLARKRMVGYSLSGSGTNLKLIFYPHLCKLYYDIQLNRNHRIILSPFITQIDIIEEKRRLFPLVDGSCVSAIAGGDDQFQRDLSESSPERNAQKSSTIIPGRNL
jgi:hypothetical protein